jgi:hypothetical protein
MTKKENMSVCGIPILLGFRKKEKITIGRAKKPLPRLKKRKNNHRQGKKATAEVEKKKK